MLHRGESWSENITLVELLFSCDRCCTKTEKESRNTIEFLHPKGTRFRQSAVLKLNNDRTVPAYGNEKNSSLQRWHRIPVLVYSQWRNVSTWWVVHHHEMCLHSEGLSKHSQKKVKGDKTKSHPQRYSKMQEELRQKIAVYSTTECMQIKHGSFVP